MLHIVRRQLASDIFVPEASKAKKRERNVVCIIPNSQTPKIQTTIRYFLSIHVWSDADESSWGFGLTKLVIVTHSSFVFHLNFASPLSVVRI